MSNATIHTSPPSHPTARLFGTLTKLGVPPTRPRTVSARRRRVSEADVLNEEKSRDDTKEFQLQITNWVSLSHSRYFYDPL